MVPRATVILATPSIPQWEFPPTRPTTPGPAGHGMSWEEEDWSSPGAPSGHNETPGSASLGGPARSASAPSNPPAEPVSTKRGKVRFAQGVLPLKASMASRIDFSASWVGRIVRVSPVPLDGFRTEIVSEPPVSKDQVSETTLEPMAVVVLTT